MRGLMKLEVKSQTRVCRRKSNMLQECFNLSQLPSPYEGLVKHRDSPIVMYIERRDSPLVQPLP